MNTPEEKRRRERRTAEWAALWCEGQAWKWRRKGLCGLADAYQQRAQDWREQAAEARADLRLQRPTKAAGA